MKVPLSWLKDYVDITLPPAALAERLTLAGLEVESVTQIGELWDRDKLFVGQILEVTRHPDADRLMLARVDYGAAEPLTVVTGAPNLYPYVGQDLSGGRGPKVAFAVAGARLVDGHSEERAIVTAEAEQDSRHRLRRDGLLGEGAGPERRARGHPHPAATTRRWARRWSTTWATRSLEFDIKGAFGHLQSVVGIAPRGRRADRASRCAATCSPILDRQPVAIVPDADFAGIVIDAPDLCLRYSAALIEGVKIGPSPIWMQQRLQPRRHAADQQRRGRHQLRHAGAGPAAARVRLRPAAQRAAGGESPDDHHAPRASRRAADARSTAWIARSTPTC